MLNKSNYRECGNQWQGVLVQSENVSNDLKQEVEAELMPTIQELVKYLNSFTIFDNVKVKKGYKKNGRKFS